jgi:hypothetical protein
LHFFQFRFSWSGWKIRVFRLPHAKCYGGMTHPLPRWTNVPFDTGTLLFSNCHFQVKFFGTILIWGTNILETIQKLFNKLPICHWIFWPFDTVPIYIQYKDLSHLFQFRFSWSGWKLLVFRLLHIKCYGGMTHPLPPWTNVPFDGRMQKLEPPYLDAHLGPFLDPL